MLLIGACARDGIPGEGQHKETHSDTVPQMQSSYLAYCATKLHQQRRGHHNRAPTGQAQFVVRIHVPS